MNVDHYTYRVTWSQEDGEHVGLCAEFPSLSWLAAKPETALAGIFTATDDLLDPYAVYNPMTIQQLSQAVPTFNWTLYFNGNYFQMGSGSVYALNDYQDH